MAADLSDALTILKQLLLEPWESQYTWLTNHFSGKGAEYFRFQDVFHVFQDKVLNLPSDTLPR